MNNWLNFYYYEDELLIEHTYLNRHLYNIIDCYLLITF